MRFNNRSLHYYIVRTHRRVLPVFTFIALLTLAYVSGVCSQNGAQESGDGGQDFASLDSRLKPADAEAYTDIWKRSPFTFTTITQPPAVTTPPGWSEAYDLAGYTKLDGVETVWLFNRITQKEEAVTRVPNKDGIMLVAYEYNPDRKLCKAFVRKNNDRGEVRFRPPAPVPGAPAPTPPAPGKPLDLTDKAIPSPPPGVQASGNPAFPPSGPGAVPTKMPPPPLAPGTGPGANTSPGPFIPSTPPNRRPPGNGAQGVP